MGVTALTLVRHGESIGNIAASKAESSGAEEIELPSRDADVPLSETGVEQADALGRWLQSLSDDEFPDVVWCSPYVRALETAQRLRVNQRRDLDLIVDERLRDRELGILDALTKHGIIARYPTEAARRQHLGKYYYRPPGGESWVDVAFRLRAALGDIDRLEPDRTVLIVAHDAVVTIIRSLCERLTEPEILQLARSTPVLNASVSRLVRVDGSWTVDSYNVVEHLQDAGAAVTAHTGDRDAFPH
ncbi:MULTISPECIES: histidine phosphatase family protein [unclassified Cryobacterium]|uniref:histidine phosphatase family protein n=1 Tax=unclassified Cryobacterium TaxID=2649013 RepID=UPI001447B62E|nr:MULTISPECIES: histidine phosphatase family protein [unclassified Cryobacterium]